MTGMRNTAAYLYVLGAAFLWGNLGVFIRYLGEAGFTTFQLIAFRSWVSTGILVGFLAWKHRSLLHVRIRDLWMFAGTGIISFLLFNFCYMLSLQMVSLSIAAILLYTAPIFVAVLSVWIFKEKFTVRKAVSLALAFGGCILVSGFSGTGSPRALGIVLGLLSGFFYSLYSIFGKVALARYASLTVTTYTFIFASIGIAPFCEYGRLADISWNIPVVLLLIAFAGGTGALAYLLYTKGLERMAPTNAAVAAILEPVVAALAGALFFHEILGVLGAVGIALVILAILILSLAPPTSGNQPRQTQ